MFKICGSKWCCMIQTLVIPEFGHAFNFWANTTSNNPRYSSNPFNVEKYYRMPLIRRSNANETFILLSLLLFWTIFHSNATPIVRLLLINISLSTELQWPTGFSFAYTSWFITYTRTHNAAHHLMGTIHSSFIADH